MQNFLNQWQQQKAELANLSGLPPVHVFRAHVPGPNGMLFTLQVVGETPAEFQKNMRDVVPESGFAIESLGEVILALTQKGAGQVWERPQGAQGQGTQGGQQARQRPTEYQVPR